MKSKTWIIIGVLVVLFGGLFTWALLQKKSADPKYENYNIYSVIPANEYNGEIADHVRNNADAPVLIFEYADYQCSACAMANKRMKKILDEYGDKIGLVYRNFLLSYHQNGTAAASAAEAAGLQGYYNDYADTLFTNQSSWESASASERTDIFKSFFETVSDGKGDMDKFISDMGSANVKKKLDFDQGIATKVIDASATPTIYVGEEKIDMSQISGEEQFLNALREKINAGLAQKGVK